MSPQQEQRGRPERFDAIVIGSGFGGAVMASRLAEDGKRVCVLERGKAYPPGSFARTPHEMANNFWRPSRAHHGLFDVWSFDHIEAVVSAGLGGGSLIYANVLIRKDEYWFVRDAKRGERYESWPVSRADLDPHYDAVERVLRPQTYPLTYQVDNKTSAMRQAAHDLRIRITKHDDVRPDIAQWYLPLLAITFANEGRPAEPGQPIVEGPNLHGKTRETCRLCGECDIGCNYGSKNTLDFNFLTRAKHAGADIRVLSEVEQIVPVPGADGRVVYHVTYVEHDLENHRRKARRTVCAERVVVSAGTLGSTLLLLRNRRHLRNLSPMLGRRFSGNGDYLAFATGAKQAGGAPKRLNASRGPVITCTFRFPDALDGAATTQRGAYLQDAGYPLAGDYIMELLNPLTDVRRIVKFALSRLFAGFSLSRRSEIADQLEALIGSGNASADAMPLLGMGRDTPDGAMRLDWRNRMQVSWRSTRSQPYYAQIDARAKKVAAALGGSYEQNPLTSAFNRYITVHPLGGSPMGGHPGEGVVDSYGQVFGHPGLYVADGSVLPGPVGANPSFTIAALADRFASQMLYRW